MSSVNAAASTTETLMPRPPTTLQWTEGFFQKGDLIVDGSDGARGVVFGLRQERDITTNVFGPTLYCATMDDGSSREGNGLDWSVFVPCPTCGRWEEHASGCVVRTTPKSLFATRIIALLRDRSSYEGSFADSDFAKGKELAVYLETQQRVENPDSWTTGVFYDDDERAREALIACLWANSKAPAYCSPSWGRNFGEGFALLLARRAEARIDTMKAQQDAGDVRLSREPPPVEPVSAGGGVGDDEPPEGIFKP